MRRNLRHLNRGGSQAISMEVRGIVKRRSSARRGVVKRRESLAKAGVSVTEACQEGGPEVGCGFASSIRLREEEMGGEGGGEEGAFGKRSVVSAVMSESSAGGFVEGCNDAGILCNAKREEGSERRKYHWCLTLSIFIYHVA